MGEYLAKLEAKERKVVFFLFGNAVSHGHISAAVRTFKGALLGFALGNIMIQQEVNIWSLLFLLASLPASFFLIRYEKRHYKRLGLQRTFHKFLWMLGFSVFVSLFTILYVKNVWGFVAVLSMTLFFSSLTYSRE